MVKFVFVYIFMLKGKRPQLSLVNKFKRMERLTEIDELLQKNKDLQEDVARKIEESRAIMNSAQVTVLIVSRPIHPSQLFHLICINCT